jgi:hypothetical protein
MRVVLDTNILLVSIARLSKYRLIFEKKGARPIFPPGQKQTPHDHSKGSHQNSGHHLEGLDKYFEVLPLVENFLNETDPKRKQQSGIFFTPYPVVSFILG